MNRNLFVGMLGLIGILAGCASVKTADFDEIKLYTLKNKAGTTVKISNYGATVTSIITADRTEQNDLLIGICFFKDFYRRIGPAGIEGVQGEKG